MQCRHLILLTFKLFSFIIYLYNVNSNLFNQYNDKFIFIRQRYNCIAIKTLKLPKFLIPENDNLIRIGESSDGSHLVDKESVIDSDFLISLGVGTIFNFEKF